MPQSLLLAHAAAALCCMRGSREQSSTVRNSWQTLAAMLSLLPSILTPFLPAATATAFPPPSSPPLLQHILRDAHSHGVPVIFALSRRGIGQVGAGSPNGAGSLLGICLGCCRLLPQPNVQQVLAACSSLICPLNVPASVRRVQLLPPQCRSLAGTSR